MHVDDVNRDGIPDIVTSAAHDYGLFWLEHTAAGKWEKRIIDDTYSQVHAVTMIDLNGDGRKDVLAGKRYMAHDHDPGAREPLGVYWYESVVAPNKAVQWVKHIVDYGTRTGGGMQLPVADIDGDGDLDFAAPGKSWPVPVREPAEVGRGTRTACWRARLRSLPSRDREGAVSVTLKRQP